MDNTCRPMITANTAHDLSDAAKAPSRRAKDLRNLLLDGIQNCTANGDYGLLFDLKDNPYRRDKAFDELVSEFEAAGYSVEAIGTIYVLWLKLWW